MEEGLCLYRKCREGVGELELELELGLIKPHMAQKPVLRGEVGARALCAPCEGTGKS